MRQLLSGLAILYGILLVSCSNTEQIRFVDDQSFARTIEMIKCEPIPGFLMTEGLAVCDSVLVVQNVRDSAIFSMVNLHSMAVVRSWGHRGRAANEYLMPRLVSVGGGQFAVVDKPNAKVEWHCTDNCHRIDPMLWEAMPMSIAYGGQNRFVFDVKRPMDLKLYRAASNVNPMEVNDFAGYATQYPSPSCYNGFVAVDTASGVIAYAFQYIDGFDLFADDGSLLVKVRRQNSSGPVYFDGRLDAAVSTTYCFGLKSTAEGLFLYRVAVSGASLRDNTRQITYIEQFDWSGNPIVRYEIPFFVSDFVPIGDGCFVLQDPSEKETALYVANFE